MIAHPYLVCKFKPIFSNLTENENEKSLEYILEIINESKLYAPTIQQLNDPLESSSVYISLAIMGAGMYAQNNRKHPIVEQETNKYRVLSFTQTPTSPLLWAHYANNYCGVCFVFSTNKTFCNIHPVIYNDRPFTINEMSMVDGRYDLHTLVKDSLLFKLKDWSYESEWRVIVNKEQEYMNFDKCELEGVIIGHKTPKDIIDTINAACINKNINCVKAEVNIAVTEVLAVPMNFNDDFYYEPFDLNSGHAKSAFPENELNFAKWMNNFF